MLAVVIRRSVLVAMMLLWSLPAGAEDAPYAEYRSLRQIGQIQIVTGVMDRTSDLASRLKSLEGQGLVVLEAEKRRSFSRSETLGSHRVATTIVIEPPVGHGEGGASSNVDLRIVVDGVVRVDCPLARAATGIDRLVVEPDRGFITLTAHEGILRFDGFEPRGLVDAEWLAARASFVRQLIGRK